MKEICTKVLGGPAQGGGGKVLSPWNISAEVPRGWVGQRPQNELVPKGTKSVFFGKFHRTFTLITLEIH